MLSGSSSSPCSTCTDWCMDDDDHNDANLGLAVKVISGEACEVSGAFAVPRQAVDHTLGGDIRGATLSLNIKKWPSGGRFSILSYVLI